jgi:hypothetical protein
MDSNKVVSRELMAYLNNNVVVMSTSVWEQLVKQYKWGIDDNGQIIEIEIDADEETEE